MSLLQHFRLRALTAGLGGLLLLLGGLLPAAGAAAAQPEWRYTLRPGDTLIGLAQRYLARPADWPRVQQLNRIDDPYRLLPGSALRIPLAWLRHKPAPASVLALSGEVRVTLPDQNERALRPDDLLPAGSVLTTAASSSVSLRFADGSQLLLRPQARLVLDTVSVTAGGGMVDTRLRLQQGRVEIGANPRRAPGSRLQVITPSAVAAVRGTQFRVEADTAISRSETLEGAVGLSAAGRQVKLAAGQGSVAQAGQPPRPPVALLPAPDLHDTPVRIDSLPLRFNVPTLPGASGWLAQVLTDTAEPVVVLEQSRADPAFSFADVPDGRYLLRVRAIDALGLQGRDAEHSIELDARPFAPLLTAPGARVRNTMPTLQWSAVVGVQRYRVMLARDAAFQTVLLNQSTTRTSITPDAPLAAGTVYWRVASIEGDDQGPFSPVQPLTYDPLPGAPEINSAAPRFADQTLTLTLPPPPAGLHYELVLARDAERRDVVWQGSSPQGEMRAAPVKPETLYLAARLVEADGTAGPYATRVIEAPPRFRWELLLLALPLLAL